MPRNEPVCRPRLVEDRRREGPNASAEHRAGDSNESHVVGQAMDERVDQRVTDTCARPRETVHLKLGRQCGGFVGAENTGENGEAARTHLSLPHLMTSLPSRHLTLRITCGP